MRFLYDLTGAEPIERFVPVYDAALIDQGELVMLGTTDPDSAADHGVAFVTAVTGSSAEAVDALGISLMARNTSGPLPTSPALSKDTTSVATLPDTANPPYNKCIINPFAVYSAEYDQADTAAIASSSTTTVTITSLEDDIDTGWIFVVSATVTGNAYNLRQLSASASGSATMDSAFTGGNETSGTAIKILPVNHQLTKLNAAGTGLGTDAGAGSGVALTIVENFVQDDGVALTPLRAAKHRGVDLTSRAKFFAAIAMADHLYNPK